MDLSLDEIIKNNKISRPKTSKGRLPITNEKRRKTGEGGRINGKVNKSPRQPVQAVAKRASSKPGGKPLDARLKIIQKNRQRLTDARQKLSEIAKRTDARTKIKAQKTGNVKERRQDRGRLGLSNTVSQQSSGLLRRSIQNNMATDMRDPSGLIRFTINRPLSDFPHPYAEEMDVDEPHSLRTHGDISGIQIALKNEFPKFPNYNQEYLPRHESMYMDRYEPPMYRPFESSRSLLRGNESRRMSQEMRARLDTPAKPYYPPPSTSPPPSQPQGHRIVVSNLHSSVTHEDIKELFEDLGPLLTSRLVRAGTAEVIYKFQKDAKKAVDAYHNRQLDGQPMKCLLVNPRTSASSGVLRSSNMPATPKFPNSSKSMVIPDLSAIHKALFTSK